MSRTDPELRLKGCPFCGGPAVNVADDYITCGSAWNPGCAGHMVRTDCETWNERPRPSDTEIAPDAVEAVARVLAGWRGYDPDGEAFVGMGLDTQPRWKAFVELAKLVLAAIAAWNTRASSSLLEALKEAREQLLHFRREAPIEIQPEAGVMESLLTKIDAMLEAHHVRT